MAIFSFVVDEAQCCAHRELIGMTLEVETFPGRGPFDEPALIEWAVRIVAAVVNGELSHNDLIDEGVHLRILSQNRAIVDTISNRSKIAP